MAYSVYDTNLKRIVVSRYFEEKLGYKALSREYGISRETIKNWVRKYKDRIRDDDTLNIVNELKLYDITDKIKETRPVVNSSNAFTLHINGYSITTNKDGIRVILEVIRNDRFI